MTVIIREALEINSKSFNYAAIGITDRKVYTLFDCRMNAEIFCKNAANISLGHVRLKFA